MVNYRMKAEGEKKPIKISQKNYFLRINISRTGELKINSENTGFEIHELIGYLAAIKLKMEIQSLESMK